MPVYNFVIESDGSEQDGDVRWTHLPSSDRARDYGRLFVQELKSRPEYQRRGLRMVIKNFDGDVLHIIPF